MKQSSLYIVPTPLGNLEDITLRALRILGQVPILAAEDTRTAQRLLEAYKLWPLSPERKLVSYFQGNEQERIPSLISLLKQGMDVALLSEAGTPGISDPGYFLIQAAISEQINVDVLPGANAIIPSILLSGFSPESFLFIGFPPRQEEKRHALFHSLLYQKSTLVFFESPARIQKTLKELFQIFGEERQACIVRELTKMYQQVLRGTLKELQEFFLQHKAKGEITLVLEGYSLDTENAVSTQADSFLQQPGSVLSLEEEIKYRLSQGQTPKEIAVLLSLLRGKPKRQIYQAALLYQNQERIDFEKEEKAH